MKKITLLTVSLLLLTALILTGCNLPGSSSEPTADIVATQVAKMLTETAIVAPPTETETPPPEETEPPVESSPTVTATMTVTPTATVSQEDPAQQLGSPAWTENFNGSSSPWDFDYTQALFETKDGYLNMTARVNPNWHSWYVSSPSLQNAYVEATISMSNCSGADRFGLVVRATGSPNYDQLYFMGVTCDGQWGFFRMSAGVDIHEIKGFQPADQLSDGTDKPHRVGIWMKGSNFTFFIDGEEVGTATDSTLPNNGYTGFLIAYANNSGYTVKVDETRYWNVP